MWWFYRKGPSGFAGASTAEEVTAGVDGRGLVAVITGASSGIGLETARVLALRGVHVVMPVRNVAAGLVVKESIVANIPGARIDVLELDLSSMASVRRFASEFESLNLPLNILINNAGVMTRNCTCSCDGLELHFATNHIGKVGNILQAAYTSPWALTNHQAAPSDALTLFLHVAVGEVNPPWPYPSKLLEPIVELAQWNRHLPPRLQLHICHFLLTNLLLENMKSACRDSSAEGRIVNVTSAGHTMTYPEGIRFDKIHDPSGLNDFIAYGQSKLANILHSNELSRIFKEEGVNISANAVHPGVIATNLFRGRTIVAAFLNTIGRIMCRRVEQGAATTCYVALHPQVKGISGKYFADCNISSPSLQASDAELAKKLWQFSLQTVSS